jgi:hypothetical protein
MPTENLIEFIIYLMPGFLSTQIYRSFYPVKERSDFIEVTWSVIYGLLIFAAVKALDTYALNYTLRSNITGFPSLRFIFALFVIGFMIGLARGFLHRTRIKISAWHENLAFLAPDPQSIWAKIAPTSQWAVVYLDDGAIYVGWISNYTFNPNHTDQDFLLSDAKRVDDDLNQKYLVDGIGVYLNTRDVKRIEFLKPPPKSP